MPEDNKNNQNPQVRKPKNSGFILSFFLVFALIGLFAFLIFRNRNTATLFNQQDFINQFMNYHINSVTECTKENSITILTGSYTGTDGNTRNYVYQVQTSWYYSTSDKTAFNYEIEPTTQGQTPEIHRSQEGVNLSVTVHNYEFWLKEKYNPRTDKVSYKLTINSSSDPYVTSFWDQWGPTILLLIGSILVVIILFSKLSNSVGGANNKALEFNRSRARRATSRVKFNDVAGCDEEKVEMEELVSYLKEPKKYSKFGAKLPKGVLLVGPPGSGKTLLAKAVAGEAGVPFYSISGSDFVEMFVGVGAGRVRDMFKTAKENAPCLIFIDEIDAVGRQRGAGLGGGNDEREQTLNQLLVEMDGFSDNAGIIVIAATNRDDVLDPALLRAGRFDRKITVSLPDRDGREAIFKVHARNKVVSPEVNYLNLARRTVGFSGADIENIMNEAAILAVRKDKTEIGTEEIDEAIDRRIAGPAKSSRSLNTHERQIVAYHEAGHAIIGLKLPHSDKVQKITIIPRGNTGGHVRMTPEEDRFLLTKKELEARIVGFLGGRSSEETFFDDISSGAQNDIEMATRLARMMVTELGMSSLGPIQYERDTGSVFLGRDYANTQKNFSAAIADQIDKEVRKIIDEAHELAKKVIEDNKKDVILIAKTLLEHEQITAEEIEYLLKHRHLKRSEKPRKPSVQETIAPLDGTTPNGMPIEENKPEVKQEETPVVEENKQTTTEEVAPKEVVSNETPQETPTDNVPLEDNKAPKEEIKDNSLTNPEAKSLDEPKEDSQDKKEE